MFYAKLYTRETNFKTATFELSKQKKNSNEQFNIFNAKMTPGDNLKP